MTKLIHDRTSVYNIGYHIVWSTKYRKQIMLKGISATKIFNLFPNLKQSLYKGHLWNSSTFIESVGHISEDTVKNILRNKKNYEPQ